VGGSSAVARTPARDGDTDIYPAVGTPDAATAADAPRRAAWAPPVPAAPASEAPDAAVPSADGPEPVAAVAGSHRRPVTPPPPLPAPAPVSPDRRDARFVIAVAGVAAAALLVIGVLAIRSRGDGAQLRASGGASHPGEVTDGNGLTRSGDGAAGVPAGGGSVRFGGADNTVVPDGSPAPPPPPGGAPGAPGAYPGGVIGLAPASGNGTVTGGGTGEVASGPLSQSPATRPGDPVVTPGVGGGQGPGPGAGPTPTTGTTAPPPKPYIEAFAIEPATAPRNYAHGGRAPFAHWNVVVPAGADSTQYHVVVSGPGLQSTAFSASGVWVCPAPVGANQCSPAKGTYPYVLTLSGPGGEIDSRPATMTVG
jgi:hypothetical protein